MKAAIFYDTHTIRVEDYPTPQISPDEVLIRVEYCGLCGTDAHLYQGKWKSKGKVMLGHEIAGRVTARGDAVTNISVGDEVVVDPNTICGNCGYCRQDSKNYYCLNRKVIGGEGWMNGGLAELVKAPQNVVYKLPPGLDLRIAVFTEPLACALRAIDKVELKCGDRVVLLGAGATGLLLLQLLKLAGASWICVTDLEDFRLEKAKALGADCVINSAKVDADRLIWELTDGFGADAVIEAVGSPQTLNQALNLVGRGGKVCLFGLVPPDQMLQLNPFELYWRETTLVSSFCNPFTFQRAIRLLEAKRVKTESLITHVFALDDISAAFQTILEDPTRCKVIIRVSSNVT